MTSSARRISAAGTAAAGAHLLLLAYTVAQTLGAHDNQWTGYWIKFLALDFPLSLGVVPLAWIFPAAAGGPLHDFPNFWWPLTYHASIGTLWWYIVGKLLAEKFRQHRRQHRRN